MEESVHISLESIHILESSARQITISVREVVEKRLLPGVNVNRDSHHGKQCGGSSEIKKRDTI